ncbi:hypothetical protein [Micromonospora deserti]|uniref:Uncharacterized protein n=1 Tax=Micromonospora deserti TaxID=2070366 RepID=A0A2W2CLB1_9ACTN|nr:hypothetical protein [Micromonospora deserti]PZF99302.1 hypothetical protein C1I99_11720 [Micromonospora deserti]
MRDDIAFVEQMYRDLRAVHWPEPEEIRARARRRNRRTAVGAATLVLVVVSGAVAVVGRHPRPAPPAVAALLPAASSTPARTEISRDALVQPGDLPAQTGAPLGEAGLGEPVRVADTLLYCHTLQGLTGDWESSRYSRSQTLLRERPAGTEHGPADLVLSQDVYRVTPEVAGRVFAGIDKMLGPCARWRSTGPAQWQGRVVEVEVVHRWEAADRNFAGDEAVLLRHTISRARDPKTGKTFGEEPKPESTVVVRVGDLVTVVRLGRGGTEPELRRLAGVAAHRMCAAANPPC